MSEEKKICRVIIVADGYEMEGFLESLIRSGVEPEKIHVSSDHRSASLAARGVRFTLPPGRIRFHRQGADFRVQPSTARCGICTSRSCQNPTDHLVP